MNHLLIGTADKTERLLALAPQHFLLIDDGPIAEAFLKLPRAKLFDIKEHSFNPLAGIDYKRARDIAAAIYTASPEGRETLTVRNGKRSLSRLLLQNPKRLDKLKSDEERDLEALATVDDLLLSPVLRRVLCGNPNFAMKGRVVLKLDRATIGDFDAFVLASLAIGQFQGHVIVPDFGFYGRDFYSSLVRQNRLVAGVTFLAELTPKLRQMSLSIKDKDGLGCLFEDAETLADYAGLTRDTNGYGDFVRRLMSTDAF